MEINTIYKRVSIAVLILSLLHTLIFNLSNIPLGLGHATIVNAAYHGFYNFLRLAGRRQIIGVMAIFSSIFLTVWVILETIRTKDFEFILVICVAAGLFLGGLKRVENEY